MWWPWILRSRLERFAHTHTHTQFTHTVYTQNAILSETDCALHTLTPPSTKKITYAPLLHLLTWWHLKSASPLSCHRTIVIFCSQRLCRNDIPVSIWYRQRSHFWKQFSISITFLCSCQNNHRRWERHESFETMWCMSWVAQENCWSESSIFSSYF